jgi:hypothetical protein
MKDAASSKNVREDSRDRRKRYALRLTGRFVVYDPDRGLLLWREWPAGANVTDKNEIELLEARGAPVERIEA